MAKLRFGVLALAAFVGRSATAAGPDLSDDLLPAPATGDASESTDRAAPRLLYLNFSDGTDTIVFASNDRAGQNTSAILAASPYPAFKWEAFIAAGASRDDVTRSIARRVHEAFLAYNVIVSTVRPTDPVYTMVMIGGAPSPFGLPPDVAGIALMDCANRQESNIVYAFPANIRGDTHILFVTIAQEAAHSYGLEHTNDLHDIMYPRASPDQDAFVDAESEVLGATCGPVVQNSHERLLQALGGWPGGDKPLLDGSREDAEPPTLRFEEPTPGAEVGSSLVVKVFADDDVRVDHVALEAGTERRTLTEPPWQWSLSHFPAGRLVLSATAVDGEGRSTTASIAVTVSSEPGAVGGCAIAPRTGTGGPGPVVVAVAAAACARRRRRL